MTRRPLRLERRTRTRPVAVSPPETAEERRHRLDRAELLSAIGDTPARPASAA